MRSLPETFAFQSPLRSPLSGCSRNAGADRACSGFGPSSASKMSSTRPMSAGRMPRASRRSKKRSRRPRLMPLMAPHALPYQHIP